MKRRMPVPVLPQQTGLIVIILLLGTVLTLLAGTYGGVNKFLNSNTIMQVITNGVVFAIMAVGVTMVIITGGIDLSVGATYALSGVMMAMFLRQYPVMMDALVRHFPLLRGFLMAHGTGMMVLFGLVVALGVGVLCGLINGIAVVKLKVHPFIITLGTMWIFRGIAFVSSKAESILIPDSLTSITKSTLGFGHQVYPVPMLVMLVVAIIGEVYLLKTIMGRSVYAVGGNADAARYCGLPINRSLVGVYVIAGLTAGIAAFVGATYYGAACCLDADGYELYVIASAVVGGASLMGGKGSALGAMLGAMLIVLIKQSITTLQLDQNYQWIIVGCAIVVAVVLDRLGADYSARRMARAASMRADIEMDTSVIT